jgi:hypothetical protein
MNLISLGIPALYYLFVLAILSFLLVRGITHLFVGLFAAGAFVHLLQSMVYLLLSRAPGGFGAYSQYFAILAIVGFVGTILFVAAFISLAAFLLRAPAQTA